MIEAITFIKDFITELASLPYGIKYRPLFNRLKRKVKIIEDFIEETKDE